MIFSHGTLHASLLAPAHGAAREDSKPAMLCLACHDGRLATLLETATELRFYGPGQGQGYASEEAGRVCCNPHGLADLLIRRGASELICGAITGCCRATLEHRGITVVPWIAGRVEQVLAAYEGRCLDTLAMPGCPRLGGRNRRQGRGGRGAGGKGLERRGEK